MPLLLLRFILADAARAIFAPRLLLPDELPRCRAVVTATLPPRLCLMLRGISLIAAAAITPRHAVLPFYHDTLPYARYYCCTSRHYATFDAMRR